MKKKTALPLVLLTALLGCQCSSPEGGPEAGATARGALGTLEWEPSGEAIRDRLRALAADEPAGEAAVAGAPDLAAARPSLPNAAPTAPAETGDDLLEEVEFEDASGGERLDDRAAMFQAVSLAKPNAASDEPLEPTTWRRAGATPNATTLRVGDEDELPLAGVEATAWVDGFRARVLLDCVYQSDREQELEGTFKLRLPEGATPYYFAFGEEIVESGEAWRLPDRDRSLAMSPEPESILEARAAHWRGAREARLVPRAKAARAYQDTVRQNVDPALLEWAGAGVFQARVFPLLPGVVHRVVVGYELDLVPVPGTNGAYELGLDFPAELPALSLDLFVLAPAGAEVSVEPSAARVLETAGGRRTFSFVNTEHRAFTVSLAPLTGVALVSSEDTGYFAFDLRPEPEDRRDRAGSDVAIFVLDTSLSSANGRFETWLDLLEAILEENRASGLEEFAVLFFDVAPRWWREGLARNDAASVAALRADAERLALEGASDLGSALRAAANPGFVGSSDRTGWDLFLLSDGAATWGSRNLFEMSRALREGVVGPLFAYTTGTSGTDRRALEHLARESSGAVFTVNGPDELAAAAVAHRSAPWTIRDLSIRGGGADLLLRGRPAALYPGQRVRLVGRGLPRAGGRVELELEKAGVPRRLSFEIARALETPLAARAYGEVATQQLESLGRATREAAEAFATRFRVPGEACSLLMLESEEDYAKSGFLPESEVAVARGTEAGPLITEALRRLDAWLEEPARALLELVAPLVDAGLELDPELTDRLWRLRGEALRLDPETLEFRALDAARVPAAFTELLASGELDTLQVEREAERRRETLTPGDAVRALSCLVEANEGDVTFARDAAQTLVQWELFGHAYPLYLGAAEARPFEPQSYLALARCAEASGKGDLAFFWYTVALDGEWDARFGDFRRIAAFDALHFLRRVQRRELSLELADLAAARVGELVETVGLARADLAVAIEWNTDATDVDLHVVEPGGEHCFYGHQDTALGAHLSRDVTQGLGPELYVLPEVASGEYLVYVHYFAGDRKRTSARSKVLATLYERWGFPEETLSRRVIPLEAASEEHGVVRLVVER